MSTYIKIPKPKQYYSLIRGPEYEKIQVYALKMEYADEYVIVYVWRKQKVGIFTHDSYLISDFHLVPSTLNYKPTPGGLKHSVTSMPRHSQAQSLACTKCRVRWSFAPAASEEAQWAYNRVSTVSVLDQSIKVIKKVMPQTTQRNDISIFSFVPYDNVFYSVMCPSKKGTYGELYLMKGELNLPNCEDPNWLKLAQVNYTPVINFNNEINNYKLNCNFCNTEHVIEDGYNIIYIRHYERSELSYEYKTRYGPLDSQLPHAKTWTYKYEYNYAITKTQTCGIVLGAGTQFDLTLKDQIDKLNKLDKLARFQIINPFADDDNIGFPELFNPNHIVLLTWNLLLITAIKETKLGKSHKGWYSNKLLFYLDYDALTAELITTYRVLNNQVSVYHIGNADSCYILLDGKQIMLMHKSSVCDAKTMDILYDLLPAELVNIISEYTYKRIPFTLNSLPT